MAFLKKPTSEEREKIEKKVWKLDDRFLSQGYIVFSGDHANITKEQLNATSKELFKIREKEVETSYLSLFPKNKREWQRIPQTLIQGIGSGMWPSPSFAGNYLGEETPADDVNYMLQYPAGEDTYTALQSVTLSEDEDTQFKIIPSWYSAGDKRVDIAIKNKKIGKLDTIHLPHKTYKNHEYLDWEYKGAESKEWLNGIQKLKKLGFIFNPDSLLITIPKKLAPLYNIELSFMIDRTTVERENTVYLVTISNRMDEIVLEDFAANNIENFAGENIYALGSFKLSKEWEKEYQDFVDKVNEITDPRRVMLSVGVSKDRCTPGKEKEKTEECNTFVQENIAKFWNAKRQLREKGKNFIESEGVKESFIKVFWDDNLQVNYQRSLLLARVVNLLNLTDEKLMNKTDKEGKKLFNFGWNIRIGKNLRRQAARTSEK